MSDSRTPLCDALRTLARACAEGIPGFPDTPLYQRLKLEVPEKVFERIAFEIAFHGQAWHSLHREIGPVHSITVGWIEVKPFK